MDFFFFLFIDTFSAHSSRVTFDPTQHGPLSYLNI